MCWFQIKVFCLTCLSQVLLKSTEFESIRHPFKIFSSNGLQSHCQNMLGKITNRLYVYHLQLGYCDWFKILGWPWLKLLHRNCISIRGMHFIQRIVTYRSFARIAFLQFLTILLDPVIQVADQTTGQRYQQNVSPSLNLLQQSCLQKFLSRSIFNSLLWIPNFWVLYSRMGMPMDMLMDKQV